MRQILLPIRSHPRSPDLPAIVLPVSWHSSGPLEVEQLFMVAATPDDLAARFGIRFQETWEDGLGRIQVALVALPSGREIFWEYANNPNVPGDGCLARVRPRDYLQADVADEVVQLFGGDPSVIIWRAPTSWDWPSPIGYGPGTTRSDLDDAMVSLSLADFNALHQLATRDVATHRASLLGERSEVATSTLRSIVSVRERLVAALEAAGAGADETGTGPWTDATIAIAAEDIRYRIQMALAQPTPSARPSTEDGHTTWHSAPHPGELRAPSQLRVGRRTVRLPVGEWRMVWHLLDRERAYSEYRAERVDGVLASTYRLRALTSRRMVRELARADLAWISTGPWTEMVITHPAAPGTQPSDD